MSSGPLPHCSRSSANEVVGRATDGQVGRARRGAGPNVLLTDIEMPLLSGLEVAAAVTSRHPSNRVVILPTFVAPAISAAPSMPAPWDIY